MWDGRIHNAASWTVALRWWEIKLLVCGVPARLIRPWNRMVM